MLRVEARYVQCNTDEPGIGWTPVLGPFPALVDLRVRVADINRDGVDTQVLSIAGPDVQFYRAYEGSALAGVVNDRATEVTMRKHPGRLALLAASPARTLSQMLVP